MTPQQAGARRAAILRAVALAKSKNRALRAKTYAMHPDWYAQPPTRSKASDLKTRALRAKQKPKKVRAAPKPKNFDLPTRMHMPRPKPEPKGPAPYRIPVRHEDVTLTPQEREARRWRRGHGVPSPRGTPSRAQVLKKRLADYVPPQPPDPAPIKEFLKQEDPSIRAAKLAKSMT